MKVSIITIAYNSSKTIAGIISGSIGAFAGGVGAGPGALIGGIIGGITGSMGGSWLAGSASDAIVDQIEKPQDTGDRLSLIHI